MDISINTFLKKAIHSKALTITKITTIRRMGILLNRITTIKEKKAKSIKYDDVDPYYIRFDFSKYYSIGEYYNSVRALDRIHLNQGLT